MRLPKIRELTDDQKKVYLYAPTDKHVLVHGPPGTGKTLIACLRAIELEKKKVPVVLGMFNRVLTRYSSNVGNGQEMPSQTVLAWFRDWWNASGLPPHAAMAGKISINVPFEEKDAAKAAGATWHAQEWRPWGKKKGVWMVDYDHYAANPDIFAGWELWHQPPAREGKTLSIDWSAISAHLMDFEDSVPDEALDVGTLLIDEGQDFPEDFYKFLRQLSVMSEAPGRKVKHPLRCFVLADENQQLTDENSTLDQIESALRIDKSHRYLLLDNFRNSREIAELARSFFADVGVLPRLPKRSSEKPVYTQVQSHSGTVNQIMNWLTNNPRKEVGVLVFQDSTRKAIFAALENKVAALRGRNAKVQTYSWKSRQEHPIDSLDFDVPDVVTVLNMQSCKGLEFDAVFIVDLQEAQIGLYGPDRFKMQMFVGVSRGRDWVNLVDSGNRAGFGPYFECLPGPEFLERDHQVVSDAVAGGKDVKVFSSVESGKKKSATEIVKSKPVNKTNSFEEFVKIASENGLEFNDRRDKGGAIWVNGGAELAGLLEPLGFAYSQKRAGWWRK